MRRTARLALVTAALSSLVLLGTTTTSRAALLPPLLPWPSDTPSAAPSSSPTPTATPTAAPFTPVLRVQGTQIVDASGRPVVLRGINRAGTDEAGGGWHAVTDAEVGWLAADHPGSWQATAVRVLMDSAQWTGACPRLATNWGAYRAALDAEVQSLTRRGVVAVLDLHRSTAGCRSSAAHAMPDAPVTQSFWKDVATRYAANPLVVFELYNEPHYVDDATWRNGTARADFQDCDPKWSAVQLTYCRAGEAKYRAVGMQELYDIVTKAAPGHLVVVDGPQYATHPSTVPLNDHAGVMVYGMHAYQCPHESCATPENDHANLPLLRHWDAVSVPVLATEFGWASDTVPGTGFYRETLDYLEQRGWGWLAYAFDGSPAGPYGLIANTDDYAPTTTGRVVYDALRR